MRRKHREGALRGWSALAVAGSAVLLLGLGLGTAISATGAATKSHTTHHATKVAGGTAYFAEPPGA